MGQFTQHRPVLLIAAVTSRYEEAFSWAAEQVRQQWGEIALQSNLFDFTETGYYNESMGSDLKKQFFACQPLIDPGEIAQTKHQSNRWEEEYKQLSDCPEQRPINIDPGYITEAKLVLVTTKDRDHRIYLEKGIYAEVTLFFRSKTWNSSRWTYPDYQRPDFQDFFSACRQHLRQELRKMA